VAEGAPLLRAYTLTGIEGSNLSLSAMATKQFIDITKYFQNSSKRNRHFTPHILLAVVGLDWAILDENREEYSYCARQP
jgi:hypothetical protein